MELPKALRARTPNRNRDDPRLRAVALSVGLVPPGTMHSDAEAALFKRAVPASAPVVWQLVDEVDTMVVVRRHQDR